MVSGRAAFHGTKREGGRADQAWGLEPSATAGTESKFVMAVGGAR